MIPQTMIEKIALPGHLMKPGEIFFPLRDGEFHSRIARKGNYPVQMVGHKQQESAVPEKVVVVMSCSSEDSITNSRSAEVIAILRLAINCLYYSARRQHLDCQR